MTTPLHKAAQMALDALEHLFKGDVAVWSLGGPMRTREAMDTLRAALAAPQGEPVAEVDLAIIRKWPEGFDARLQHVWLDVVSFIPSVKLYDLQRTLAEFGLTMKVYDAAPHPAAPVQPAVCPEHDEWVAQGMKPCDNPAQCWEHCGQLGKSLEHASVSQRQTCFDCAKAMIYPRPDDCQPCGEGLINAYVKEQQPGPLTATQFFAKTTSGVSTPIKSPVKFMGRPVQPDINCLTCLCEGLPVVIAGVEVDRCVPCKDYSHWRAK